MWAAIKGIFSFGTTAKLSIVDYLFDKAYDYYSNVDLIVSNVANAYAGLVTLCDKLDYYVKFIPTPWIGYYQAIRDMFCGLRDMLADGKVERVEIESVALKVKQTIAVWHR